MLVEAEKMVKDTAERLEKATLELQDLVVSAHYFLRLEINVKVFLDRLMGGQIRTRERIRRS